MEHDFSHVDCFCCGKRDHKLQQCPKLSHMEREKMWEKTKNRWVNQAKEPKVRRAGTTKTGVNHLSTDTDVGCVASSDARSIGGISSQEDSFQWYLDYIEWKDGIRMINVHI